MAGITCPHCAVHFSPSYTSFDFPDDEDGKWAARYARCSNCERVVIWLRFRESYRDPGSYRLIRPRGASRPLGEDVPGDYAADFHESVETLTVSAKASAALSRRLLQRTLREQAGVEKKNLYSEIQEVIDSDSLPSDLAGDLDAVREIGNFAAHPIKSTSMGVLVDVAPGEAEWLLNVLEELLHFYFVRPAERKRKRNALSAKLTDAGKPALKSDAP